MIRTGTLILALSALAAALPAAAQDATPGLPPPLIEPCASPASYALDFLIGRWSVAPFAGGAPIATSVIERAPANCEINERWIPVAKATGGLSLMHRRADDRWHGYWIDDEGHIRSLDGGMQDGALVLGWEDGSMIGAMIFRVTYKAEGPDRIRQTAELRLGRGDFLTPPFSDLLYTRLK